MSKDFFAHVNFALPCPESFLPLGGIRDVARSNLLNMFFSFGGVSGGRERSSAYIYFHCPWNSEFKSVLHFF